MVSPSDGFFNDSGIRQQHRAFYLVVYTQTDAHLNHYICGGGLDLGLNETGIEQAKKMASRFRKNSLKIKKIWGSPELRVVQMCDILHDEIKVKMSMFQDFSDQLMGDWEGTAQSLDFDYAHPPRGETKIAFEARVKVASQNLLMQEERILLVTHLRVARIVLAAIGIMDEVIPGVMYSIDLPAGQGQGLMHEV